MTYEDWYLMRPVLRGLYKMESLLDGSIDLEHVALANHALDVEAENERRWHAMMERSTR